VRGTRARGCPEPPHPSTAAGSTAQLCRPKEGWHLYPPRFSAPGHTQVPPAQQRAPDPAAPSLAEAAAGSGSPVCSGREMCILQLVLTTARPPASRAETMGPSGGSFSMRSLTSCVPGSGDGVVTVLSLTPHPIQHRGAELAPRGGEKRSALTPNPGTPPSHCKSSLK